jgi:uncharacterized membrane protein
VILYNTLVGVCAGLGMVLTANLTALVRTRNGDALDDPLVGRLRGYGAAMLALGMPLTVLAGAMTLTWPLTANPPVNIAFGEPSLLLGVLLTIAGVVLMHGEATIRLDPVLWLVHVLGWVLLAIASAIWSYDLIGDAPAEEPITGQATGWENPAFALAYLVAACACLAAPWAFRHRWAFLTTRWGLTVAGVAFLAFSVLNYRTHIGLLLNLSRPGEDFRW